MKHLQLAALDEQTAGMEAWLRLRDSVPRPGPEALTWIITALLLAAGSLLPVPSTDMLHELGKGALSLLPAVLVASLLAGALSLGNWADRSLAWLSGGQLRAVLLASLIGAITPVCGLAVLPLIAALLRRGLSLAPVMAFWVSSPVTDPGMLVITTAIIGLPFALAKTVAAFGVGVLAGGVTALLPRFRGPGHQVMRGPLAPATGCDSGGGFWQEVWISVRLVLRWLALALVLEILLKRLVPDETVVALLGKDAVASVPLAALVGAPMYLDGYAALPLLRALLEKGMSFGAGLALMISGAAISMYAAVAVISLVRPSVFALYVGCAVLGAIVAGYIADWLV